jgi:hypothetical protein
LRYELKEERHMAATAVRHLQPTHISVTFKILMPDELRKISFSLVRDSGSGTENWNITFQLFQRASTNADFPADAAIELDVVIDETDTEAHGQATATAKHGLDADQRAQALTAADTSQAAQDPTSGITQDDAKDDTKAIVTSRSPNSPV